MSGEGTPAPGGAPAANTLAADAAWAQFSPEIQGAFSSKGWDKKSPAEAAAEAMKSYHEVEKHIGIPKEQIVRMPKDAADKEGWNSFYRRIGVPEKPEGYDLSAIKFSDGTELDEGFVNFTRNTFFENGVPAEKAATIAQSLVKFMEGAETDETAAAQAALAAQKDAVNKSWGANKEANMFIVKQAVAKLGLDENVVTALEQSSGYEKTMQALLKIGQAMGEDKFVSRQDPNNPGVLTREQAQARKEELKRDTAWVAKFNDGDYKANNELIALDKIISGVA